MTPASCRRKRVLEGPPRPPPPRVRLTLAAPRRGPEGGVYSDVIRGRRGAVIRIWGPATWLEKPPSPAEVARILCCASDTTMREMAASILSAIIIPVAVLPLIPWGPGLESGLSAAGAMAIALGVEALRRGSRRDFEECLRSTERGAPGLSYYQSYASLITSIIGAIASEPDAERLRAETPLGPYEIRVRRGIRLRITATPAPGVLRHWKAG